MPYNRAMSKRAKVAAEIDEETLAGLDRIAADRGAFEAYMKVGEDAADGSDTVSQEEMREWFAGRVAARRSAAAAAE